MDKHVPLKRLMTLAAADDVIVTLEESKHLKVCSECFTAWTDFVVSLVPEHELVN